MLRVGGTQPEEGKLPGLTLTHNLPLAQATQVGPAFLTCSHQDHLSPQVSEHRWGGVGMNRLFSASCHPTEWAPLTCTPRMPKMMKKAQQMSTMLPMGLREEMRVSTTSFRPGARLMTLQAGKEGQGYCEARLTERQPQLSSQSSGLQGLRCQQEMKIQ